jgi:hypothetical protein
LLVVGILAIGLWVPWVAHAQSVSLPRNCHPWGRFKPGVWSQVRKVTEEFDEAGNVKSVSTTETKTTLVEVSDTQCKLNAEVAVEVAGKLFTPQPKTVVFGYNGETSGQAATVVKKGAAELEVGERKVPCVQLEATLVAGDKKLVSTIFYANTVPPYVLKRVSQTLTPDGKPLPAQSTVEVIAADMPYAVLNETRSCAFVRTVSREGPALSCTVEVFCIDVPGGVVAHTSRETDERGRLVRRSTLELLDFGTAEDRKPTSRGGFLFHRTRPRRITGSLDP